jgi:hypothetical protein
MALNAIPADTSPDAARVQMEVFRRMAPEARMRLALQMSASLRAIVAAGVRYRHPEFSAQQVKLAAIRICLGDELFRRVYPSSEVP